MWTSFQEIMIFWYKLKLNMIWCEIATVPHTYAFKDDKVIQTVANHIHNQSKNLSTFGKLQLVVFLCRVIQEEISEVKMIISDLDISLILNQNNLVRKMLLRRNQNTQTPSPPSGYK